MTMKQLQAEDDRNFSLSQIAKDLGINLQNFRELLIAKGIIVSMHHSAYYSYEMFTPDYMYGDYGMISEDTPPRTLYSAKGRDLLIDCYFHDWLYGDDSIEVVS